MSARGTLFIISAPSGAGKSSLIQALLQREGADHLALSVSHTTRAPRPGETDGVHYHFVKRPQFDALVAAGAFVEYAEVFGNCYGTASRTIDDALDRGVDLLLDIDWQGARQIRAKRPDAVSIFILPPSRAALEERLTKRGQDSADVIAKRMAKAVDEIRHYDEYDYVIVNDDFNVALEELDTVIRCQRLACGLQSVRHGDMLSRLLADSAANG